MKFPAFYGNWSFIAAFTSVRHLSLLMSQLDPVQAPTSHFLNIHLNIILPSTSASPNWSLSIKFPHQNPVHISSLLHMHYMPRPSNSSGFDLPNDIGWGVLKFSGKDKRFISSPKRPTGSEGHPTSLFNGDWDVFTPSIERPWREVNHSLPSYTEVTNERCCTSIPPSPHILLVWTGTTRSLHFTHLDYFMLGHVKDMFYRQTLPDREELCNGSWSPLIG